MKSYMIVSEPVCMSVCNQNVFIAMHLVNVIQLTFLEKGFLPKSANSLWVG